MNQKQADRAHAIETLRKMLTPGDTVTTTVLHVSRSGMSRVIMCQAIATDYDGNQYIRDISGLVADAIGDRWDNRHGGVVVTGCGMNMCFATVYNLGRVLFPNGFGIEGHKEGQAPRRPKTPAAAASMVRNGWRFRGRNGDATGWDNDGGYALNYR